MMVNDFDDFEAFFSRPENADKRFELIDGEIVELPPSTAREAVLTANLAYFFQLFVLPRRLGYVIGPNGGFKLTKKDFFDPDVAYVSKARWPELKDDYFDIAPDLAVEVISPSEREPAIEKKVATYFRVGT